MTIPDIRSDFALYVDWLNPVTLTLRGSGAVYNITHAHRNEVRSLEHLPAGGDVRQGDTIWQFPISESTDPIPLGSTLQVAASASSSSGVIDTDLWTILNITKQVWSSKWEAHCRNLVVSEGLNTQVDITQATYLSNSDGEYIPAWAILALNVRAKIQLLSDTAQRTQHVDDPAPLYQITFQSDLPFDSAASRYRIVDPQGLIYGVVSLQDLDRIDVLPKALCHLLEGYSSSGIA